MPMTLRPFRRQRRLNASIEDRRRLARMLSRLFDLWALPTATRAAVLGLPCGRSGDTTRYALGLPLAPRRELLQRAGQLLRLHAALKTAWPCNPELSSRWMTAPNRAFQGMRPIDLAVRDGIVGMRKLEAYLLT